MPGRPAGVTDVPTAVGVIEVDGIERGSPDITTTLTADPGASGVTVAVADRGKFPQAGSFKARMEAEVVLVTAGHGTGAGNFTVTRAQDGTTGVAHGIGVVFSQVTFVQRVETVAGSRQTNFLGRSASFRTPGRAGTSGQKIGALHNAAASTLLVNVKKLTIDTAMTVIKAVTVLPPLIRIIRFTSVPTNGTALAKVAEDTSLTSSASVTLWQDASADGTGSGSALAVTLPASNIMAEIFAPRFITAVGYEPYDRHIFLESLDDTITLRPGQGICVFLDYVLAIQNPVTDMWAVGFEWEEFLPA